LRKKTASSGIGSAVDLIRYAFSDERPDIFDPNAENNCPGFEFREFSFVELYYTHSPEDWYEWDASKLELLEDSVSKRRYSSLLAGAEPTQKERNLFSDAARQEEIDWFDQWGKVGDIFCVRAPEDSGETRAVYFYTYRSGVDDYEVCVGPLRDTTELQRAFDVFAFPFTEYRIDKGYPEVEEFLKSLDLEKLPS